MVHVIPFLTIMELLHFIIIFLSGCNLQVSIQKQDEKGRYYVLLFADSGHTRVSLVTKHVAGTCRSNVRSSPESWHPQANSCGHDDKILYPQSM